MKTAAQIRQEFIDFFSSKYNHTYVKSAPVAPLDDPTLLFTNAGMNQFKDVFIGNGTRPYSRAVNSQKVIRASGKHNDLDDVGHDTYHHTFFEMLGNWSFGDYGKEEAITWAWELLTDVWKLDKSRLYASVYKDDSEAFDIWKSKTDINPKHILYFDEKDNFWEMGATGPCGPCSEIHYDKGGDPAIDGTHPTLGVNSETDDRFIEIWNLVFMQYFRKESGELEPLKAQHVDTGMGFERIVSVLQGKNSNYDTDVFMPLLSKMEELSGQTYNAETDVPFRVAVDHIRSLCFSIADGALPSNEGRGYVLRRMLRRAARYGRTIGLKKPYLYQLAKTVIKEFSKAYPELKQNEVLITKTIQSEEEQFNRTLDKGLSLFDDLKNKLQAEKKTQIAGEDAFKLYDTYGFPLDLTEILAEEHNLTVDSDGFEKAMEAQRSRARKAGKFNVSNEDTREWSTLSKGADSVFRGYETLSIKSEIRRYAIVKTQIHFILAETPFYAESGGQVADSGTLTIDDEKYKVIDVRKEGDQFVHIAEFNGNVPKSAQVFAEVNDSTRRATANNHTATHLLHQALKTILGDHIGQAGSYVDAERLRFDFNHFEKASDAQLQAIERLVNQQILANTTLSVSHQSYDDAIANGAMALFGEKYGDTVRVVKVGEFSTELCGGTHVTSTGQIGSFQIVAEASIASGVRRIEAITGIAAFEKMLADREELKAVQAALSATPDQVLPKIESLQNEKKNLEKSLEAFSEKVALQDAKSYLADVEDLGGIKLLAKQIEGVNGKTLKMLVGNLIDGLDNHVIAISSIDADKIAFAVAVSKDLQSRFQAGKLVGDMAKVTGGGGGGRPDLATAGGRDASKLDDAFAILRTAIEK